MRKIKGFLPVLVLLAFALGSYASVHDPTTPKAIHHECVIVQSVIFDNGFVSVNPDFNNVAILQNIFIDRIRMQYFVPQTIGKVITKANLNYPWMNIQKYYTRQQSFLS